MKKVFISPSNQYANMYAYGNVSEKTVCTEIAENLSNILTANGVVVYMYNALPMEKRVKKSNALNVDLHIPIHTNAFNETVGGTRLFTWDSDGAGYNIAEKIYKYLAPLTPGTSDDCTTNQKLYEIKNTTAPAVYCECEFHDVEKYAKWIIEHTFEIADAIAHGICDYFGIKYLSVSEPEPEPETKTLYCVQVGAFAEKKNAENYAKKVEKAGFDTYIKQVDGLYKIQIGAYAVKSNADVMLKRIKNAGFDAFISTK